MLASCVSVKRRLSVTASAETEGSARETKGVEERRARVERMAMGVNFMVIEEEKRACGRDSE